MAKVQHTCTGCVPNDASIIDVYVTLVETNKSVTNAEAGRTEAEAARVVAETQRTATFATDHNRAVADHSIAQSDHATAGSDHTSTVAATNAANAAAAVANAKAELVQARLDTADADHTRAEGDHSKAVTNHSTASSDHTTAQSDHTTAGADHTRAETDHSTAASDHTASGMATAAATAAATLATEKAGLVQDKLDRADTDHTRAESDHTTAVSDHGIAGTDHTTATGDHATASADHTLAGADHTTAAADHTQAASDHTLAAADHTTAGADHTQALADHEVMEGYDTRLTNTETEVSQLRHKVGDLDADINGATITENIQLGEAKTGKYDGGSATPVTTDTNGVYYDPISIVGYEEVTLRFENGNKGSARSVNLINDQNQVISAFAELSGVNQDTRVYEHTFEVGSATKICISYRIGGINPTLTGTKDVAPTVAKNEDLLEVSQKVQSIEQELGGSIPKDCPSVCNWYIIQNVNGGRINTNEAAKCTGFVLVVPGDTVNVKATTNNNTPLWYFEKADASSYGSPISSGLSVDSTFTMNKAGYILVWGRKEYDFAVTLTRKTTREEFVAVYDKIEDAGRKYVDFTNGVDTNDGSKASPFKTIQKGINSKAKVLYVTREDYGEDIVIDGVDGLTIVPLNDASDTKIKVKTIYINNSKDIYIRDVWADMGSTNPHWDESSTEDEATWEGNPWIIYSSTVHLVNCYGSEGGQGGFHINNTYGLFENCRAWNVGTNNYVASDGFNIHGYGLTIFKDCVAHHCIDDGISHHEDCEGVIDGGEFYNNGSGIAPACKRVSVTGVYCHDCIRGIEVASAGTTECRLSNCASKGNVSDLYFSNTNAITMWNMKYTSKYVGAGIVVNDLDV